jgi:hypothetical protein
VSLTVLHLRVPGLSKVRYHGCHCDDAEAALVYTAQRQGTKLQYPPPSRDTANRHCPNPHAPLAGIRP